jgi:hypothetical protein
MVYLMLVLAWTLQLALTSYKMLSKPCPQLKILFVGAAVVRGHDKGVYRRSLITDKLRYSPEGHCKSSLKHQRKVLGRNELRLITRDENCLVGVGFDDVFVDSFGSARFNTLKRVVQQKYVWIRVEVASQTNLLADGIAEAIDVGQYCFKSIGKHPYIFVKLANFADRLKLVLIHMLAVQDVLLNGILQQPRLRR